MSSSSSEIRLRDEFVSREGRMAVLFPSEASARAAVSQLRALGVDMKDVELVMRPRARRAGTPPTHHSENEIDEAGDEIAQVAEESFSDDEKILAQVRRALGTGAVAISFLPGSHDERREELARRLKAMGALAVYYFGPWTTEWL
jgi:hypothetical protein